MEKQGKYYTTLTGDEYGTEGNEDYYLSAVLHAAIAKSLHRNEKEIIEEAFEVLINALEDNINDDEFKNYVCMSYEDLIQSVKEYGVLRIPSIDEVLQRIAKLDENGEVEGLINEVDIKEVNSDSDIQTLLNITTGELKLENSLTIFVASVTFKTSLKDNSFSFKTS